MTTEAAWRRLDFDGEVKALVRTRQQRIPGSGGPPICYCCGEPIQWDIHYHHRKPVEKGGKVSAPGDGRPANCIAVHGRVEGEQCHWTFIHNNVATARANGWIILRSAPLAAYRMPLMTAWLPAGILPERPWIVLDDNGGFRQATEKDLRGDYSPAPRRGRR
jgi:hypothetical protein